MNIHRLLVVVVVVVVPEGLLLHVNLTFSFYLLPDWLLLNATECFVSWNAEISKNTSLNQSVHVETYNAHEYTVYIHTADALMYGLKEIVDQLFSSTFTDDCCMDRLP